MYAFHEGFADTVALFQHFSLPGLLDRYIQQNRTDLSARSPLVELAQQFGEATGQGKALRDALGDEPDPARLARSVEPHERGSILVAAIFDAFFATYQAAIADLVRIAPPEPDSSGWAPCIPTWSPVSRPRRGTFRTGCS